MKLITRRSGVIVEEDNIVVFRETIKIIFWTFFSKILDKNRNPIVLVSKKFLLTGNRKFLGELG